MQTVLRQCRLAPCSIGLISATFSLLELAYDIQLTTCADSKGLSYVRAGNDLIAAHTAALRPMILGRDDALRK